MDIWMIGDSILYWAGRRAMDRNMANLKLPGNVIGWNGVRGMKWADVHHISQLNLRISTPGRITRRRGPRPVKLTSSLVEFAPLTLESQDTEDNVLEEPPQPLLPAPVAHEEPVQQQPPAPTFAMASHGPTVKISNFSGHPGERAEGWYNRFSNICKHMYGYTDDKVKATFSFYLTGQALAWYNSLSSEQKGNPDTTLDLFWKRFDGSDGGFTLGAIRQRQLEGVSEYFTRFLEATNDHGMPTPWLVATFIDGLVGSIRKVVKPQDLQDLESARKAAFRAEQSLQDTEEVSTVRPDDAKLDTLVNMLGQLCMRLDGQLQSAPSSHPQQHQPNYGSQPRDQNRSNGQGSEENLLVIAPMNKNTIPVRVLNQKVNALIDTGASVSCASKDFVKRTGLSLNHIEPCSVRQVVGVSGSRVEVLGKIDIPVVISGVCFSYTVLVLDHFQHHLILGIDFLYDNKCFLDLGHGKLYVQEGLISASLSIQSGCAKITKPMTIPARGQADIPVSIPRSFDREVVLLEPVPLNKDIRVARCLVKAKKPNKKTSNDCHSIVRVLNPTEEDVDLPINFVLASVSRVLDNEVVKLSDESATQKCADVNLLTEDGASQGCSSDVSFNISNSNLTEVQCSKLKGFLQQNADVFSTSFETIGKTSLFTHRIETEPNAKPVRKTDTSPLMSSEFNEPTSANIKGTPNPSSSTNDVLVVDLVEQNDESECYTEFEFEYGSSFEINAIDTLDQLSENDMSVLQRKCPDLDFLIKYLESREMPDNKKQQNMCVKAEDQFVMKDGLLYRLYQKKMKGKLDPADYYIFQLAVPRCKRQELLFHYHDNLAGGGHFGITEVLVS
ncbi:hypothetical protein MAR_001775 [Mya arenaria]|uniref:Retrotransposon gag domain-containing protein n=1 Tax=Mya arenaria TaxID=6604 RepID=A0ABY7FED4_MYAAR|nr:hypothetical protein MAR_001775 [Mya arenaria]